ncbi:TPA: hypothetical protein ACH3X1_011818 [Trebouxia sp. C0004]
MGCRQSKEGSEPTSQQNSTLIWLTSIKLPQYYAAFYTSGYTSVQSIIGLTDNHLSVIQRCCPDGIPPEHRHIILAAAEELSSQFSPAVRDTAVSATPPWLEPSFVAATQVQPSTNAAKQNPAKHSTTGAALQTQATRLNEGSVLGSTWSSYTSAKSSENDLDSLPGDSGTAQPTSTITPAHQQPEYGHSTTADATDRPAPSQGQLQVLYSQMEADFKKLQDRPAHARAGVRAPSHVPRQEAVTVSTPAEPAHVISRSHHPAPKAVVSSGYGPPTHEAAAASKKRLGEAAQQRDTSTAGATAAVGRDVVGDAGASGRTGTGAALRQMKKGRKSWPDEPFVQVFTNFHTLAQDAGSGIADAKQPCAPDAGASLQSNQGSQQLIAAQHGTVPGTQQVQDVSPAVSQSAAAVQSDYRHGDGLSKLSLADVSVMGLQPSRCSQPLLQSYAHSNAAVQVPPPEADQGLQTVTHRAGFASSSISYQTPQVTHTAQSSQRVSSVTHQSLGQTVSHSESQHTQSSAHETSASHAGVLHNARQGQGTRAGQQQPYAVHAMQQSRMAEYTVSSSHHGNQSDSQIVRTSSSHSEFSFTSSVSTPPVFMPGAGIPAQGPGSSSAAAEALRVIRAAKLHRHGPPARGPALIQAPASRLYAPEQNDAVRQHMQQMDAQIRQKVHQLQQHL